MQSVAWWLGAIAVTAAASAAMADEYVDAGGCQVWADSLEPGETAKWSGACEGGQATGVGVLEWTANGDLIVRFEGTMVKGKAEGMGKAELAVEGGHGVYEGPFVASTLEGFGKFTEPDGGVYEGDFYADLPHGHGRYKAADGTLFWGELKEGLPHGEGYFIEVDGEMFHGIFAEGVATVGTISETGATMKIATAATDATIVAEVP